MRNPDTAISVALDDVAKVYGTGTVAVEALNLSVRQGEFFSLLGPSGCGKTTTLRMIAGFEEPNRGRIALEGRDVTWLPPHRRDMGMVFQNYALFPHRTVFENVAFGLKMRKVGKPETAERVTAALAQVELTGFEDRYPAQLSGGQQQRVALARAIVIRPKVLLCDEPLGALDKKLRAAMQFELKELQRALGVTLIYVTHDQEEALTMSDRIAVMNHGRVEQIDTPETIYNHPSSPFVSGFIGESTLFTGRVTAPPAGGLVLVTDHGLSLPLRPGLRRLPGARLTVAVRPEQMRFTDAQDGVPGHVVEANFLGTATLYKIRVQGEETVLVRVPAGAGHTTLRPGIAVRLSIPPAALVPVHGAER